MHTSHIIIKTCRIWISYKKKRYAKLKEERCKQL